MILLTAAYGNQGKLLLPKLVAAGLDVRACVLSDVSGEQVRALGAKEVLVGDITSPAVLTQAIRGIDKIYYIGPSAHTCEREMGIAMVDAAASEGVKHFIFSSVLHAITTELIHHKIKRDIEEHLLSSGLEYTVLQPTNYMIAARLHPAFKEGVFRLPWSLERRQSMVALDDITDVALSVLLNGEPHYSATYELASEGRYTAHDIARIIGKVVGKSITAEQMDIDTYLSLLFGDVDPAQCEHQIRVLRSLNSNYSQHDFTGNPNVLSWLLERQPMSLEQFVRSQYAEYTATNN